MKKNFLLLFTLIGGMASAQVPTSGLVARYDFSTSATFTTDGSSSGYSLCTGNTPEIDLGPEVGDSSVYFGGTDYLYYCGGNGTGFLSGSVSISAWFRVSQFNTYNTIAVMRYDINSSPYNAINLFVTGGANAKVACAVTNGVEIDNVTYGTTSIQLGQWYHAVCTYSELTGEVKLYLNNSIEGTTTLTPSGLIYSNDQFTIGHIPTGAGANGFIGHIDEVLYYDRAIGPEEVCEIYTGAQCAVPVAPTNLNATLNGSTQVDLTWTDNATDETGYNVQRSDDGGVNFTTIATPGANTTSYSDATTSPATTYHYRVFASNNNGNSANSNVVSITTNTLEINETSDHLISVAPNPSGGEFSIIAPEQWQHAQITITAINGISVYESSVYNFSAPQLEKGIYILSLSNGTENIIKRIVIE